MSQTVDIISADTTLSLTELFNERVRRTPDATAYRQYDATANEWRSFSWRDIDELVGRWRGGLVASGLKPGDRVAVLLKNSVEWVCFDLAALSTGLVSVPLHTTDGPHNWADRLADAEPRLLLVGQLEDWRALQPLQDRFPVLERTVCMERAAGTADGMVHVEAWLPTQPEPATARITSETIATITYTSGTTGRPKGVVLTHGNIVLAASATLQRIPGYLEDVFLSFLPMAHIYERTTEYYLAIMCGGQTAFARSIADLPEDFATIRPTIVMAVPRILERIWKGVVTSAMKNPLGRWLIRRVAVLGPDTGNNTLAERAQRFLIKHFVGRKLVNSLGGRLRLTVCGGAPLSADLARSLCTIGLPLLEGYGLAEAAGPVSGDRPADYQPGAVGAPLDGVEIRIAGTGEILMRSGSVMSGYWRRPDDTARALDKDGWLHTGDVGELQDGRLYIHGRMRDLIVLSTGEKVAPAEIESQIIMDPLFEQALVIGDKRPIVAALVVLEADRWNEFAEKKGLDPKAPNAPASEQALCEHIGALCRPFPEYAQIRRTNASFEPWTADDGLLSVTLKVNRDAVSAQFKKQIEGLFVGHE